MSQNPVQDASQGMINYPSGRHHPSLKIRIASAVFMLDATIGIGNAIGIALLLIVLWYLFFPMVAARFFPPRLSQADQDRLQQQLEWPVYISETFVGNQLDPDGDWDLNSTSYDDYDIYREIKDGQYVTTVDFWTSDCCIKTYHLVTRDNQRNFILSVDFTKQEGDEGSSYGVVFHYRDKGNYYLLTYNDVGNLSLDVWYENKQETVLVVSSLDGVIQPLGTNRLTLSIGDGRGLILINDQYISQFSDNRIPRGRLGFVVGAPFDGYTVSIGIDNIELRTLD